MKGRLRPKNYRRRWWFSSRVRAFLQEEPALERSTYEHTRRLPRRRDEKLPSARKAVQPEFIPQVRGSFFLEARNGVRHDDRLPRREQPPGQSDALFLAFCGGNPDFAFMSLGPTNLHPITLAAGQALDCRYVVTVRDF